MLLDLGDVTLDLERGAVVRDDVRDRLTSIELALLRYLADRLGEPVDREELHREVWGHGPQVLSRALDTTVRRLRRKLEVDPKAPRHLLTVHGVGYRLLGSQASPYRDVVALVGPLSPEDSRATPPAWVTARLELCEAAEALGGARDPAAGTVAVAALRALRRAGPYGRARAVVEAVQRAPMSPRIRCLLHLAMAPLDPTTMAVELEAAAALADDDVLRCRVAMDRARLLEAPTAEEAVALARSGGHLGVRAEAVGTLAVTLHDVEPDRSQGLFVGALELAQEAGDTWEEAIIAGNFAGLLRALGDTEAARRYYERTLARLRACGDDWNTHQVLYSLGTLHQRQLRFDEAAVCFADARAVVQRLDDTVQDGVLAISEQALALDAGRPADTLALEDAMRAVRGHRPEWVALALDNLGLAWLQRGQLGLARTYLERALAVVDPPVQRAEMAASLAQIDWAEGERARAWSSLADSLATLRGVATREAVVARLLLLRARWADALGETVDESELRELAARLPAVPGTAWEGLAAYR
jgi:tetratricopeptide (TPR) repeat protein